ncbi:MAG: hypothetical protein ACR2K2_13990 [Mycobacteriales bacterium]
MALHWRPVGPEPEETYWWRRASLLAGLGLVVFVLPGLLTALFTGGADPDRLEGGVSPTSSASSPSASDPSASDPVAQTASPTATPPAVVACPPAAVQILAGADQDSYPVGGAPMLELRVTNTGTSPCTLDLGPSAVELLVYSGGDRIWSSDDCASGDAAKITPLLPGEPSSTMLSWDGQRSLPGCEGPKAPAQPGTYRVTGRVGELRVEGGSFRFTG